MVIAFSQSVQSLSRVWLFVTPWTAALQASLSIVNSWSLLELMPVESVMPSKHEILCRSLLLQPSIFASIRVFSSEWVLRISGQILEFQLQHQSFQWIFMTDFPWMDWLDLLTVQGTLKSLLQHHSLKASVLWLSAFFIVRLSHPSMTTAKTMTLTIWTFVGKVMSPLFNALSGFVIAFLPSSKCLLISWLQSPSAVMLEPPK